MHILIKVVLTYRTFRKQTQNQPNAPNDKMDLSTVSSSKKFNIVELLRRGYREIP